MQKYIEYIRDKYKLVYEHIDLMCIARLVWLVHWQIRLISNVKLINQNIDTLI